MTRCLGSRLQEPQVSDTSEGGYGCRSSPPCEGPGRAGGREFGAGRWSGRSTYRAHNCRQAAAGERGVLRITHGGGTLSSRAVSTRFAEFNNDRP